jgi:hypothetical protein
VGGDAGGWPAAACLQRAEATAFHGMSSGRILRAAGGVPQTHQEREECRVPTKFYAPGGDSCPGGGGIAMYAPGSKDSKGIEGPTPEEDFLARCNPHFLL